jgi:SAM-dependent methyltransferase
MTQSPEVVETLDVTLTDIAAARHYNDWIYSRARPFLGGRTLDVGAGLGTFATRASADGVEVVALEPEAELADRLERIVAGDPNVRVLRAAVEELHEGESFDSAMCFNVLEHLPDDVPALRALHDNLRPGGSLLVLVPSHPSLYGPYDASVGHVRRYTARALRTRLDDAGFEIVTLRRVNPIGAIGWFVRVRLLRQSEWPSRSFRLFDRLTPVLRPLDRVPLPLGLSLWAVARRS